MEKNQVFGSEVSIGEGCQFGHNVVVYDGTVLGKNIVVGDNVVLGRLPMRVKRSVTTTVGDLPPLQIGDGTVIGTGAIVYRGATIGAGVMLADNCQVREKSTVGDDTIIGRNVTIENKSSVGARCKIETNAYITAFSEVGDDCFIAPMVTFTNDPYAGRSKERFDCIKGPKLCHGARIGANATILPGLVLHEDCLVAAGAVVTRDVPAKTIVVGCPAHEFRPVPENQLLENQ